MIVEPNPGGWLRASTKILLASSLNRSRRLLVEHAKLHHHETRHHEPNEERKRPEHLAGLVRWVTHGKHGVRQALSHIRNGGKHPATEHREHDQPQHAPAELA